MGRLVLIAVCLCHLVGAALAQGGALLDPPILRLPKTTDMDTGRERLKQLAAAVLPTRDGLYARDLFNGVGRALIVVGEGDLAWSLAQRLAVSQGALNEDFVFSVATLRSAGDAERLLPLVGLDTSARCSLRTRLAPKLDGTGTPALGPALRIGLACPAADMRTEPMPPSPPLAELNKRSIEPCEGNNARCIEKQIWSLASEIRALDSRNRDTVAISVLMSLPRGQIKYGILATVADAAARSNDMALARRYIDLALAELAAAEVKDSLFAWQGYLYASCPWVIPRDYYRLHDASGMPWYGIGARNAYCPAWRNSLASAAASLAVRGDLATAALVADAILEALEKGIAIGLPAVEWAEVAALYLISGRTGAAQRAFDRAISSIKTAEDYPIEIVPFLVAWGRPDWGQQIAARWSASGIDDKRQTRELWMWWILGTVMAGNHDALELALAAVPSSEVRMEALADSIMIASANVAEASKTIASRALLEARQADEEGLWHAAQLGVSLRRYGADEVAQSVFRVAFERGPSYWISAVLPELLQVDSSMDIAAPLAREGLKYGPYLIANTMKLAATYRRFGDIVRLEMELNRASSIDEKLADSVWAMLAFAYAQEGDLDMALDIASANTSRTRSAPIS